MPNMLADKQRGAFFTPPAIAQFLADWAIRSPSDAVLEPSCGEAVFLEAAARRLGIISRANEREIALRGIEIHEPSARNASDRLEKLGYHATIECRDFFDVSATGYDVVLGNPPFVRYQSFSGVQRKRALEAALRQGVPLKRLSSAWAAFLIHASSFVQPFGRLGFVLPAELLATHYAADVRAFLLRRFASLKIILFETLIFPSVNEEVILLLAEGSGGCDSFEVVQAKDVDCLVSGTLKGTGYSPPTPGHKWTSALLHQEAQCILSSLAQSDGFDTLSDWGDVFLGFVSGHNAFFTLNEQQRRAFQLDERDLAKICPPGARKLSTLSLSEREWCDLRDRGSAVFLFYPADRKLSASAAKYLEFGISKGVPLGYKCSNRSPWWRVPLTVRPDLVFTYMNHTMPRIISNAARVHVSNSMYGIALHRTRKTIGRSLLPRLFFNSVSALSSEVEGRSYGGGLLKHEPREADRILVPSLVCAKEIAKELRSTRVTLSNFNHECSLVDELLVQTGVVPSLEALAIVKRARNDLLVRRKARNRSALQKSQN